MMFASTCVSSSGHVHRGAGRPGHRRDRADVVEVRVGDQDRLDRLDPEAARAPPSSRSGLVARVDDHRVRRRPCARTMKQFSCTGPTVNMRTSIISARPAASSRMPAAVQEQLDVVAAAGCRAAARTARRTARSRPGADFGPDAATRKTNISAAAMPARVTDAFHVGGVLSRLLARLASGTASCARRRSAADPVRPARLDRSRRPCRGAWCGACAWSGPW